ncbi:hypothetical protein I4U23_000362 [Adineta vaga]|nr:hypothetical protein I4U23_000362 [Adineta vaga]
MAILPITLFDEQKYRFVMEILEVLAKEEMKDDSTQKISTSTATDIIARLLLAYKHPSAADKAKSIIQYNNISGSFTNVSDLIEKMNQSVELKIAIDYAKKNPLQPQSATN